MTALAFVCFSCLLQFNLNRQKKYIAKTFHLFLSLSRKNPFLLSGKNSSFFTRLQNFSYFFIYKELNSLEWCKNSIEMKQHRNSTNLFLWKYKNERKNRDKLLVGHVWYARKKFIKNSNICTTAIHSIQISIFFSSTISCFNSCKIDIKPPYKDHDIVASE